MQPDMDFVRTCGTAIQTLNGWSTVRYEVYTTITQRSPDDDDAFDDAKQQQNIISTLKLVETLRQRRYIAHANLHALNVWVFLPTAEQSQFSSSTPSAVDLTGVSKSHLCQQFSGTFSSSDLASRQSMSRAAGISLDAGNGREDYFASGQKVCDIYSRLIEAVSSSLAYWIVSNSSFISLNSSVLLSSAGPQKIVSDQRAPGYVTAVGTSLYLTSAGSLIISRFPFQNLKLATLSAHPNTAVGSGGRSIVVAPIGVLAVLIPHGYHNAKPKLDSAWSTLIKAWLTQHGLSPPNLDNIHEWTYLELLSDQCVKRKQINLARKFLWPTRLWYVYHTQVVADGRGHTPNEVDNVNVEHSFLDDLLQFSALWYQNYDGRDQKSSRQTEASKDQFIARSPEDHSWVNAKSITYGDLHGGAGVYPTPPDGLASQALTQPNMLAPSPLQSTDTHDISAKNDHTHVDTLALEQLDHAHDDLFDDEFEGNDITDADFSFFDAADNDTMAGELKDEHDGHRMKSHESLAVTTGISELDNSTLRTEDEDFGSLGMHTSTDNAHGSQDHAAQLRSLKPDEVLLRLFSGTLAGKDGSNPNTGAFSSLQFNTALREFQARYDIQGTFGFQQSSPTTRKRAFEDNKTELAMSNRRKKQSIEQMRPGLSSPKAANTDDDSDSIIFENQDLSQQFHSDTGPSGLDLQLASLEQHQKATANILHPSDLATVFTNLSAGHDASDVMRNMRVITTAIQSMSVNNTSKNARAPASFTSGYIALAQLITDQFHHDTLDTGATLTNRNTTTTIESNFQAPVVALQRITTRLFAASVSNGEIDSALLKYASISDPPAEQQAHPKSQSKPPQPKAPNPSSASGIAGTPLAIPPQFVRIRRNDALWDMRAPAIAFWDVLGLSPTNGPKNVSAFALFPNGNGLEGLAHQLVDDIGQCYENARLGKHIHDKSRADLPLSFPSFQTDDAQTSKSFSMQCVKIGNRLALIDHERSLDHATNEKSADVLTKARIIYVINPFNDPSILHNIVHGFMALREAYRRTKTSTTIRRPDVVLKVVALSHISSPGGIVLLSQATVQMLAREVYNRCPPANSLDESGALSINSGSSIQLMESLPRKIAFELSSDPPSSIMQDPSHLHLGYSISESGNWITAAFTDNAGRYQATVSYCVTGSRTFLDIAREMWQTCVDIMKVRRVTWRLYILRVGTMPANELEAWASLAASAQSFTLLTLIFTLDLEPPISLLPPVVMPLTPPATGSSRNTAQTPTGTPNTPVGISPDPSAQTPAAGTPSEHANVADVAGNDSDAHLLDMTDETCAIIIGHRITLSVPSKVANMDFLQALSSALIIRVPPATPTSNPFNPTELLDTNNTACIALHLLWARNAIKSATSSFNAASVTDTPPSTPGTTNTTTSATGNPSAVPKAASDNILREAVTYSRNLALLAKVRGIKDGMTGLVPWHALVAQKAVAGLDSVYGLQRWSSAPNEQ